jgi:hypothetical protein
MGKRKEKITYKRLANRIREWMNNDEIQRIFECNPEDDISLASAFLKSAWSYQKEDGSYLTYIGKFELIE